MSAQKFRPSGADSCSSSCGPHPAPYCLCRGAPPMTVAVGPSCACSGSHARARPLLLRRVRRQELLGHAQRPEVPRAAVHHIRRVVRTRPRVIERNRALIFRVPSILTWCSCLRWGIWGSGRSDQSFCPNTDIFFPPASLPFFKPRQDGTESPLVCRRLARFRPAFRRPRCPDATHGPVAAEHE